MRVRAITESERAVALLESQIKATSLVEMRSMFFRLIQEQTEKIMLARVRPDYLFKVIDPAIVSEDKVSPNRAVICIVWTLIGGFMSILIVVFSHFFSREKSSS